MPTLSLTGNILNTDIAITNIDHTCEQILRLAETREPGYVCFATAHMLVEATRNIAVRKAYDGATIVNPDGTPVSWCLRAMGHTMAQTVNGPRTMPYLLAAAEAQHVPVGFYGGRPETLELMKQVLKASYPELQIAFCYSPPFRTLEDKEQQEQLDAIERSGARLLFVGLGSPKQEIWMYRFSPALNCLCLGVGAAFEFLSGEKIFPPVWIQQLGLTWLVRLCQEPRRLAKRNLYSPLFAAMFLKQQLLNIGRRSAPATALAQGEQPQRSLE